MAAPTPPAKGFGCVGRLLAVVGGLLAIYLVGLLFVPPVQTATRTVVLVPELIELPIRPLSAFTPEPVRTTTSYGSPADRMDVYTPVGAQPTGSLPGVVLVLGVHPQPIDHPDVVRIAASISRLGVVVGVQDSTALRETRVEPDEPAHLADAVLVLAALPEVNPQRIGIAGFSAGASIGLIAAADPRIAADLRWVSNFGGYASAELLLVDVATRTMELDGEVLPWAPDAGIRRDVLNLLLAAVDPADVRQPLRDVLEPVVAADEPPSGPDPAVERRFAGDALVTYRLFTAADRGVAERALTDASPDLRAELAQISPLTFVDEIRAHVFTMHGVGDNAIPYSHAVALHDALDPAVVGRFTSFGRFGHAQPGQDGLGLDDLPDIWELTLHLHHIVAAATE
jgi:dienelactone hydrolase